MSKDRLRFGDFELDVSGAKLERQGRPVKIQPQPFRVLSILASQHGDVVSRDELRRRIWDSATFVEFDQGLNYCIRQIRVALQDDAAAPVYIETVKGQGYRFIAPVSPVEQPEIIASGPPDLSRPLPSAMASANSTVQQAKLGGFRVPPMMRVAGISLVLVMAISGGWLYFKAHASARLPGAELHQVTDFADSAVAPAISPDGRMLAFIHGASDFLTPDQIYIKMLPDGEAKQLTNDPRLKYGPAFSPDGSEISYTVMENSGWSTYTVSILGGEPRLLLNNAAGLSWLDRNSLLFSQIRAGQHMGIVLGTPTRSNLRELYFPSHERGMAHYSFASPDRTAALVVEMNEKPVWLPCRLIALNGQFPSRTVGPNGLCTAAGWSPDGRWMYFSVVADGQSHIWRQYYPDGIPEQLTSGPTNESGIAVDPDGRSILTSVGSLENTLWMHLPEGDRPLSSEGRVVGYEGAISLPTFSNDAQYLFYLLHRESVGLGQELWRLTAKTGERESLFPGISVLEYDVSPDGTRVIYTTQQKGEKPRLWLSTLGKDSSPAPIGAPGDTSPHFGPEGEILFRLTEGKFNYLARMNPDGSGRAKVVPYPISTIQSVSPNRRWVMAVAPLLDNSTVAPMAIPVRGGNPVRICEIYCEMAWSTNGKFVFVSVEEPSLSGPGRTLAIPTGPHEDLPPFPVTGIPARANAAVMPGSVSVPRAGLIPNDGPNRFVYVQESAHRNLFRLSVDQ